MVFAGYIWFDMLFALLLTFAPIHVGFAGHLTILYIVCPALNVYALIAGFAGYIWFGMLLALLLAFAPFMWALRAIS